MESSGILIKYKQEKQYTAVSVIHFERTCASVCVRDLSKK